MWPCFIQRHSAASATVSHCLRWTSFFTCGCPVNLIEVATLLVIRFWKATAPATGRVVRSQLSSVGLLPLGMVVSGRE